MESEVSKIVPYYADHMIEFNLWFNMLQDSAIALKALDQQEGVVENLVSNTRVSIFPQYC